MRKQKKAAEKAAKRLRVFVFVLFFFDTGGNLLLLAGGPSEGAGVPSQQYLC
jgi:hypothetical protein